MTIMAVLRLDCQRQARRYGAIVVALNLFAGWSYHALALQGLLNAGPHPGTGVFHGNQQLGGLRDIAQVGNQVGTEMAGCEVLLLLSAAAAVNNVRQDLLKLRAR